MFRSALLFPVCSRLSVSGVSQFDTCCPEPLLTEACLRDYRTSLFIQSFTTSG